MDKWDVVFCSVYLAVVGVSFFIMVGEACMLFKELV